MREIFHFLKKSHSHYFIVLFLVGYLIFCFGDNSVVHSQVDKIISGPIGIAIGQNNKAKIFVSNFSSQSVSVFDDEYNIVQRIPVEFAPPQGKFSTSKDYVIFPGKDKILVFPSLSNNGTVISVPINGASQSWVLSNSARKFFVATDKKNLNIIDLETNSIIKELKLNFVPKAMAVDADGKKIYQIDYEGNKIIVADASSGEIIKEISVTKPAYLVQDSANLILYRRKF